MKYLIILTLISLSLTIKEIGETLNVIKKKIAGNIKDFPKDTSRLIKNIDGYVDAYKEENVKWDQIRNIMIRWGCRLNYKTIEEKKSGYSGEMPLFDINYLSNNQQKYTLTYNIVYCDRVDDERANLVCVKGKYSGILQPIIEKEKLPCRIWMNTLQCEERYVDSRRSFTKREWYKTQEILKIQFYQVAMDKLNKLG